jgi:hypothetical protein
MAFRKTFGVLALGFLLGGGMMFGAETLASHDEFSKFDPCQIDEKETHSDSGDHFSRGEAVEKARDFVADEGRLLRTRESDNGFFREWLVEFRKNNGQTVEVRLNAENGAVLNVNYK